MFLLSGTFMVPLLFPLMLESDPEVRMKEALGETQLFSAKWFLMIPKPPLSISSLKNLLFSLPRGLDFSYIPAALSANCKFCIHFCPGSFENRKILCITYSNRSIICIFCCDLKHSEWETILLYFVLYSSSSLLDSHPYLDEKAFTK